MLVLDLRWLLLGFLLILIAALSTGLWLDQWSRRGRSGRLLAPVLGVDLETQNGGVRP